MSERATWSFILVAAGSGSRIGGTPKQFRKLGAEPMWVWSARTAEELFLRGMIDELIVVFPIDYNLEETEGKFKVGTRFIPGGMTRTESVLNALRECRADFVLIHDAARPFISAELCAELIQTVSNEPDSGAVPLLESVDSLKKVDCDISVLPREKIFRTQTPQAFRRTPLEEILASFSVGATDEAALWIDAGKKLFNIRGSERNFKITTDFDWIMARALVETGRTLKVGMGYDVHELVPGRKLILGGVEVSSALGLLGHSDADIICHAVSDALLGAVSEGDIGLMFPSSDARYKDADSSLLLKDVLELVVSKGWHVVNVDVTLKAQIPKLGSRTGVITDNLKRLFTQSCPYAQINIKVKSGEQVGSVGRAECMECYAVAQVEKNEFWKGGT